MAASYNFSIEETSTSILWTSFFLDSHLNSFVYTRLCFGLVFHFNFIHKINKNLFCFNSFFYYILCASANIFAFCSSSNAFFLVIYNSRVLLTCRYICNNSLYDYCLDISSRNILLKLQVCSYIFKLSNQI